MMKTKSSLMIMLLAFGCTSGDKSSNEDKEHHLLGVMKDDSGRVLKKAEAGRIPGEDIWLTISRLDTKGNIIEEYGARPYGHKYKDLFKYDTQSRLLSKRSYEYGEFENYGHEEYELNDTLVDWRVTEQQLVSKILFVYDDNNRTTREMHYSYAVESDSLANALKETLELDTVYKSADPENVQNPI